MGCLKKKIVIKNESKSAFPIFILSLCLSVVMFGHFDAPIYGNLLSLG